MKKNKNQKFRGQSIWLVYGNQLDIEIVDPADGCLKRPWILTVLRRNCASIVSRQMLFRVPSLRDYDKAIDAADGELQNPWKDWQMPQAIETESHLRKCGGAARHRKKARNPARQLPHNGGCEGGTSSAARADRLLI